MRAETPGFKTYVRAGIGVLAGESPRIDIQSAVGNVSESITVTGGAPLIETETSTVSATVPHEAIMRLTPLQDRSFNVMMYEPGVANTSEATFYMLGQRSRSIGKRGGWVSAKMPVQGTPVGDDNALLVGIDSLEEARVVTTGVPAEFGSAGSGLVKEWVYRERALLLALVRKQHLQASGVCRPRIGI